MYDRMGYKQLYLDSLTKDGRKDIDFFFNNIAEIEEKIGKDIVEMDDVELFEFLEKLRWSTPRELSRKKGYISKYFLFHSNPLFAKYDLAELRAICLFTGDFVFSYKEIKEMERIINERENGWYYNAIMFCAFYGFDINQDGDYWKLRICNIDFDEQLIKFDYGRVINMENKPELSYYLKKVIEHKCEYSKSNSVKRYIGANADSVFKVADGGRIANVSNAFHRAICDGAMRVIKEMALVEKFGMRKISNSGLLHEMKKRIEGSGQSAAKYLNNQKNHQELNRIIAEFGKAIRVPQFKFLLKNYLQLIDEE